MKYLPNFVPLIPGLLFCFTGSIIAISLCNFSNNLALDPLVLSLVFGVTYRNIFFQSNWQTPGAKFAGKYLLEFAVFILGASIYIPSILSNGNAIFLLITFCIIGSMAIAYVVGHIVFGLNKRVH